MWEVLGQVAEGPLGRGAPAPTPALFGISGGGLFGRRGGGDAVLLDVFQGELELLGIETLGLRAGLATQHLLEELIQPLAFRLGLFVCGLEVIPFLFQAIALRNRRIPLFLQRRKHATLPFYQSSHFGQLSAKLVWVFRNGSRIKRHGAVLFAPCGNSYTFCSAGRLWPRHRPRLEPFPGQAGQQHR